MEFYLLFSPWLISSLLLLLLLPILTFILSSKRSTKLQNFKLPPPATGGWPFLGHLLNLSGPDPLHITLTKLSDTHGPIFTFRLGSKLALAVNTWEMAKQCYRNHDITFSNRPKTASVRVMGYNFAMLGFSDYGPYWREMRKISVLRLLSNRKVAAFGCMIEHHVRTMMGTMNKLYYDAVKGEEGDMVVIPDLRTFIGDLTTSLMVKTVAGNVDKEIDVEMMGRWKETIRNFFRMMNVVTVSDVFPWLKWVDYFGGMQTAFRKTGGNFDRMLHAWLVEHKKLKERKGGVIEEEEDFMSEMMSVAGDVAKEFPIYDADTINKANCQVILFRAVNQSETS